MKMDGNHVRNILLEILQNIGIPVAMESEMNTNDINLLELEMDSLAFFTLIIEIENIFSIELPDDLILPERLVSFNAFVSVLTDFIAECQSV